MTDRIRELAEEAAREIFPDYADVSVSTAIIERALRKQKAGFEEEITKLRGMNDDAANLLVHARHCAEQAEAARDAAVRETIERCAKVCEKRMEDRTAEHCHYDSSCNAWDCPPLVDSLCEEDIDCATAIRALAPDGKAEEEA